MNNASYKDPTSMQKNQFNQFKQSLKTLFNNFVLFPKFQLTNQDSLIKIKKILNLNDYKRTISKSERTDIDELLKEYKYYNELLPGMLLSNFSYETEYISKQFSFFQSNGRFMQFIFLSNLYKIFLINVIQSSTQITCLDFYSIIILISPDFPKHIIKKINIIYMNFKNKEKVNQQHIENLGNTVNTLEFFSIFAVYFAYLDLIKEIENVLKITDKNLNTELRSKITVNEFLSANAKNYMKEDNYLEILISCDQSMLDEYNKNTVNTVSDVIDILEKNGSLGIPYLTFLEKMIKNYNFMRKFFIECTDDFIRFMEDTIENNAFTVPVEKD